MTIALPIVTGDVNEQSFSITAGFCGLRVQRYWSKPRRLYLPIYRFTDLPIYRSTDLPIYLPVTRRQRAIDTRSPPDGSAGAGRVVDCRRRSLGCFSYFTECC